MAKTRVSPATASSLPAGVPAPARPEAIRDGDGRFQAGEATSQLAGMGGKAAAESRQLAKLLGLLDVPEGHPYLPYARMAREWRDAHMAELGQEVGGGKVGPGPASVVSTAALEMAASRWLFDRAAECGDTDMMLSAARLADASRQNLLAAHELVARMAEARKEAEAGGESAIDRMAREAARLSK